MTTFDVEISARLTVNVTEVVRANMREYREMQATNRAYAVYELPAVLVEQVIQELTTVKIGPMNGIEVGTVTVDTVSQWHPQHYAALLTVMPDAAMPEEEEEPEPPKEEGHGQVPGQIDMDELLSMVEEMGLAVEPGAHRVMAVEDMGMMVDPMHPSEVENELARHAEANADAATRIEQVRAAARVVARATDPGTSWEAAGSVRNVTDLHRAILNTLRSGPMTDEQIYAWLYDFYDGKVSTSGARTRRKELVDMGRVEWTGELARTKSNRRTKVWRLASDAETEAPTNTEKREG